MKLRFIPQLNLAALIKKKGSQLFMWYCLRAIDTKGHGMMDFTPTLQALVRNFKYSKSTAYRILMGKGFWDIRQRPEADGTVTTRIKIWGIKQLCLYAGISLSKHTHHIEVPVESVPKTGKSALLWSTGAYKPISIPVNPICRQSLEEMTGIERRKQQRWDLQARTLRAPTKVKYHDPLTHKLRPIFKEIKTKKGSYKIQKQLGNIYHSRGGRAPRGQLMKVALGLEKIAGASKIAEAIDSKSESFNTDAPGLPGGASPGTSIVRRYFKSVRDFVRAHQKGKAGNEGYCPLKKNPLVYVEYVI